MTDESARNDLLKKSEEITNAICFQAWHPRDVSELFWMILGEYVKEPTFKRLKIMERAWLWAVHEDHALANSFVNAWKWTLGTKSPYVEAEKHRWEL